MTEPARCGPDTSAAPAPARPSTSLRRENLAEGIHRYLGRHPGRTVTQLQAEFGRSREYIIQAARDLISAGLIVRVPDPHDGRVFRYVPAEGYEPPAEPRRCTRCEHPLPPYRKRFCSDLCHARHRKKERGAPDYAGYISNLVARMGTRAASDLEVLSQLAEMTGVITRALAAAVEGCRAEGHSDAGIGQALGITRQAVGKRFPRQPKVDT